MLASGTEHTGRESKQTHLAVVDTNDRANHLGDDDHVAEVGLHDRGLLVGGRLLLGLTELLDEAHRLALETALEPSAGASVDDLWDRAKGKGRGGCEGEGERRDDERREGERRVSDRRSEVWHPSVSSRHPSILAAS